MEEKDKLTIEIEEAKSFFVLAQIMITLAGFMFVLSGVFWTNSINSNNFATEVQQSSLSNTISLSKVLEDYVLSGKSNPELVTNFTILLSNLQESNNKLSESFSTSSKAQSDLSNKFIWLGCILMIFSAIFWVVGNYKINNLFYKH
jgi:hypothetical protein